MVDPSGLLLPGSIVQPLHHFICRALHLRLLLCLGLLLRVISIHGLLFEHAAHPHLRLLLGFLRPLIHPSRGMFSKVVPTGCHTALKWCDPSNWEVVTCPAGCRYCPPFK